jgi:hypothetical protein
MTITYDIGNFSELEDAELFEIDGGGPLSAAIAGVAGGLFTLAGAICGVMGYTSAAAWCGLGAVVCLGASKVLTYIPFIP